MRTSIALAIVAGLAAARSHTFANEGVRRLARHRMQEDSTDSGAGALDIAVIPDQAQTCADVPRPADLSESANFMEIIGNALAWTVYCTCNPSLLECQELLDDDDSGMAKVLKTGPMRHVRHHPNPIHRNALTRRADDDITWIPLPPDRNCYKDETYTEECDDQWLAWDEYCWWNWTEMCERVDYEWYYGGEEIEWLTPDLPEDACFDDASYVDSDSCNAQWETLDQQCYGYGDYYDSWYKWTEECDILDLGYELDWVVSEIDWLRDQIEARDCEGEGEAEAEWDDDWGDDSAALLAKGQAASAQEGSNAARIASYSALGVMGVIAAAYAAKKCSKKTAANEEAFLRY